ncbi:uncharacterized protein BX664DRAFT_359485 [Halteromyces radiatus]|uniref:uncharacterized protein n=1 Tax=Halteromyces radiatus TaxID=101107 RepID=UPI0022202F80|nr:uncharacterized protein BX664DRAFT_359485 [Halteromyces radiatus]KAI8090008.1 hypothetical protein BX664DRAFT_359485 [Halteromyces radiatus]
MAQLKNTKTKLDSLGYTHHCRLNKEKQISSLFLSTNDNLLDPSEILLSNSKSPLCQNVDIVIPEKKRTADRLYQLQQFLTIIGNPIKPQDDQANISPPSSPFYHSFIFDDELRNYRIQEFIETEISYVETIRAALKYVVRPLTETNKTILNTYKCSKIFLNLSNIYKVNQDFLNELQQLSSGKTFGDICSTHMTHFSCYRKYLLEQHEAQNLHTKEMKSNPLYRRFVTQAKEQAVFKRRRFQDILLEPVQRISRYAMMFKDILQLTPQDHPDFIGLKDASMKVQEIAIMDDDTPTKVATMFLNLYQAVKDCPCSLINPNRSLITFVDAIEIQRDTNKPARTVTLFLFTDKIMIATRPPNQRTSEELDNWKDDPRTPCGVPDMKKNTNRNSIHGVVSLTNSSTSSPSSGSSGSKKESNMKFKGWIDLEHVEIFNGNQDLQDSFLLHTITPIQPKSERRDSLSSITFEKYFRKCPRLFSIIQHPNETTTTVQGFREAFEKAKALAKQYSENDQVYQRQWDGINVYSNIYNVDDYRMAKTRNNMTILYMEDSDDLELQTLFGNLTSLPWVIAVVQSDIRGFRFHICSRTSLPVTGDISSSGNTTSTTPSSSQTSSTLYPDQTIDFERVFWNNILLCERRLRLAPVFSNIHDKVLRNEIQRKSKSRSVPRPPSLTTISKLFNHGIALPLSPTSPRASSSFQVTPISSKSMPMKSQHDRTPLSSISTTSTSKQTSTLSNSSWNDSAISSHSVSSSSSITTSSLSTKPPVLRRFASKSSNALYSTRKRYDSSTNANMNDQTYHHQCSSSSVHNKASSLNISENSTKSSIPTPSPSPPISTTDMTKRNERTRSYSFSTLSSSLQRSSNHEVPIRPVTCSAIDSHRRHKESMVYSSKVDKNLGAVPSDKNVSTTTITQSSNSSMIQDLGIGEQRRLSTSSHCRSDTLSSFKSTSTKNSSVASLETMDEYDDTQEIQRQLSMSQHYLQQQQQQHEQVLEVVAGAIENMGMDIHEKWQKMTVDYQSLLSSSALLDQKSNNKGTWQNAYAMMINETFSMFTDLTTELEQIAAIVNTHRNR